MAQRAGDRPVVRLQIQIDFFIRVDQNIEVAEHILQEAMLTSQYVYLPKPITVLVKQVIKDQYVAIHLRLTSCALDTKHEKCFETDVSKRALLAFREHGVLPAILHRHQDGRAALPVDGEAAATALRQ